MIQSSSNKYLITLFFILSLSLLTAFAQANESDTEPIGPPPLPEEGWEGEIFMRPVPPQPRSLNAVFGVANDTCTTAGTLTLQYDGFIVEAVGDQSTNIGTFTTDFGTPIDPNISCLAGTSRPQGYRSAWYRVTAPVGGTMTIETVTDQDYRRNYDTVIAVFTEANPGNACANLTEVVCNDDHDAFLSKVEFRAEQGQSYLVEVVDRNIAASGPIHINLEVSMAPDPGWENVGTGMPHRVSRHAVVMNGNDAYVIAGQNVLTPDIKRLGQVWRFETDTGNWVQLPDMPANESIDGRGYSATDAALVGDQIHMISGYVGSADSYAGDHWVYDIPSNSWRVTTDAPLNWNDGGLQGPVGYSQLTEYAVNNEVGFYLTGGLSGKVLATELDKVRPSAEVRRYVEIGDTKSWAPAPDMNTARYAHTAALIGTTLCVAGGLSTDGTENQIVNSVECYNRFGGTGSWVTIDAMNTSRFYAGSAVGPDGTWYVFGGRDMNFNYVNTIEAINLSDPTPEWRTLDISFNIDNPPFAWLRGDFVGERLYLFGGDIPSELPTGVLQSHDFSGISQNTNPLLGQNAIFLPGIYLAEDVVAPATAPLGAPEIFMGSHVIENFDGPGDAYDIYEYNPTETVNVMFDLAVPSNADYDLLLYDENKNLVQVGNNIGRLGEWLNAILPAGKYYLLVARVTPPPSLPPSSTDYHLFVTPHHP